MKIISMRSLGNMRTYSPEMKSGKHNYLANSGTVHSNSHALAYCLVSFRCLFLKCYFPYEWWASVMSNCDQDKMVRYISVARQEGVDFLPIDISNMTMNFSAIAEKPRANHLEPPSGYVYPGLISLKGIGEKAAKSFACSDDYESLDDFVAKRGRHKILLERLIKLGSFRKLHSNSKALWFYYQCKYCSGPEISKLKSQLNNKVLEFEGWADKDGLNESSILEERQKQSDEFKRVYPKRKVPNKILNWLPKPIITLSKLEKTIPDYKLEEVIKFEEVYLGYNIHSPLSIFRTQGGNDIDSAKKTGRLEGVISSVRMAKTKSGNTMCRVSVTDGVQTSTLILWQDDYLVTDKEILNKGIGIRALVKYDENFNSFTLIRPQQIIRLSKNEERQ